ncbi:mucin-5AC-like isoform X3 [Haliotis rufescens]|uniref:mucin-5AC-like isoform X2 n=1 Tax=Haliotis rufescens TaxID=6454 RepID=UPI00201F52FF|nr:mucin-5AC-like isoform X2 [Haliotis rufescens]XP_046341950.2 mucin-5AC-like isoform X3 [Haliotis rufescens]
MGLITKETMYFILVLCTRIPDSGHYNTRVQNSGWQMLNVPSCTIYFYDSKWYNRLLKMMVKQNQVHVLLVLTVTFIHGVSPTQAPCPGGVATLETEYNITCDRSNYTGFIWVRPTDDRYVVTCNPSCSPVAGYSATMNATHSTLTIHSVGVNDAGTWRIQDAINDTSAPQGVCEVMVSNISSTTRDTPTSVDISSTSGDTPTSSDSISTTAVTPTSTGASLIASMCPAGVGLLEADYTITGDRSSYTGFIWVRPSDGRYVVTCNPSCSPVAGYRATMNDTHSTLTIHSVKMEDAGTWKIVDATVVDPIPVDVCHLTAAKIPQCNISSDVDTDALELGTNLTVTVYINGYYCSQETVFNLTTGVLMETLLTKHNVSDVTTDVINKTINIVLSRFGDVTVSFACDVMSSDLSCSGVKSLLKSPPQCNISSDTDTDVLEPGTTLTLTVDIRGYFCSQQAGFDLTTGSVTDVLLQNQTTHNITDTVQHHFFNVSSDRLGNVSVMFRCDNSNRSLTCDGVSKLSAAPSPTTSPTSTAAPSPTTSPTSTGTSNTSPSSPTASERSSTPTSPSTTESSPSDLTLGLAIGLTLLFCVIALAIALRFHQERLKKNGKYIVTGKPGREKGYSGKCQNQCLEMPIQDNLSSKG